MISLTLASLWLIFPLRLLAESMAAAEHQNGGFMTNNLGAALASIAPVQPTAYISWWAYSFSLGIFFVALPFSRYMHIPTEIVLIFLRKYGIENKKSFTSFSDIEVHSCSRCGICIDVCQIPSSTELTRCNLFISSEISETNSSDDYSTFNCLVCGRCENVCPVGITINNQRLFQRSKFIPMQYNHFKYLESNHTKKAEVVYFAGCADPPDTGH
ncbi:MAG: 4Fe-4S dicluster domain-containing protein [Sphingobacterium sp.]|nr:4Fe-4S dicluster domain-containing protein [Sphingobacterium sp.]